MSKSKLVLYGLLHSLAVTVYIILVAYIMYNGQRFFGAMNGFIGPVAVLLLFVLSAAVTGSLVFGRPAYMYLNGQKAQAVEFLLYTIGWLFVITVIVFVFLALFPQPSLYM